MDYLVTDTELTGIANAIRTKGGTSSSLVFPDGFVTAIGNISGSGNNQEKTGIEPTESSQTITPDTGYTGLSSVQINGISSSYVGSEIARNSSSDLTTSGATVTAPAGYYASDATKTVESASPSFTGGDLSDSSKLVSSSNATFSINNTSGIVVNAYINVSRSAVVYNGNVSGFVNKSNGETALSGDSDMFTVSRCLTGVTIQKPSSGTRQFSITVPNGNGTIIFVFTVDSNGNVVITES